VQAFVSEVMSGENGRVVSGSGCCGGGGFGGGGGGGRGGGATRSASASVPISLFVCMFEKSIKSHFPRVE
jgi:hypothetical protein